MYRSWGGVLQGLIHFFCVRSRERERERESDERERERGVPPCGAGRKGRVCALERENPTTPHHNSQSHITRTHRASARLDPAFRTTTSPASPITSWPRRRPGGRNDGGAGRVCVCVKRISLALALPVPVPSLRCELGLGGGGNVLGGGQVVVLHGAGGGGVLWCMWGWGGERGEVAGGRGKGNKIARAPISLSLSLPSSPAPLPGPPAPPPAGCGCPEP